MTIFKTPTVTNTVLCLTPYCLHYTPLAQLDAPRVSVAPAGIPRGEATGLSILDAREFMRHDDFLFPLLSY